MGKKKSKTGFQKKLTIVFGILLLSVTVYGCRLSKKSESRMDAKDNTTKTTEGNKPVQESQSLTAVDTLIKELEDSKASEQSYDTMTVSEQIAQYIMDQVEFVQIEERPDGALVQINYPDAGNMLIQLMEQYPEDPDKVQELLRDALRDGKAVRATLETEVLYEDSQSEEIIWTDDIVNAMSGGLYALMSDM